MRRIGSGPRPIWRSGRRGWIRPRWAGWAPGCWRFSTPTGPSPPPRTPRRRRGRCGYGTARNGGVGFEGYLDGEHGPALRELIERLAAPRPAADHIPDARGVEERQADALVEICDLARSAEAAPSSAGEPPHLTLTLDLNMLIDGIGAAALDYGTFLSAADARRWACEAKIIPVVCGGKGEPLDVGRAMRTVPAGVRRALVVRDKGCAFPGCGRPPARCSAHHNKHWVDGGQTSVANCCLLCEYHHRLVHNTGWGITIHPDRVEFIPPAVLDPDRRPLRNPLRC
ncbi:MAG: DUF222 domain-containing protein [Pseudonocardiaceae bacterium]|nr:DUF222 domain-containing protein [Pseudonocardiaceae bacterium]